MTMGPSDETTPTGELDGVRVAMLAADGVSRVELEHPRTMLEAAGARVHLVAPRRGEISAMNRIERTGYFAVDVPLVDAAPDRYEALVLPGGVASVDHLRRDPDAVAFTHAFLSAGKPVGAICHAPWLLVQADDVRGRTLTSWPSLRVDIENAGGTWVDEQVHVDRNLVTSRKPADLPAFSAWFVREVAAARGG